MFIPDPAKCAQHSYLTRHDAQVIAKVEPYLKDHDTKGLDIHILAPVEAMNFSLERIRKGETNEDMLAAGIMEGTGRTWEDPAKFVYAAHKGIWGHNNTLSHDIV